MEQTSPINNLASLAQNKIPPEEIAVIRDLFLNHALGLPQGPVSRRDFLNMIGNAALNQFTDNPLLRMFSNDFMLNPELGLTTLMQKIALGTDTLEEFARPHIHEVAKTTKVLANLNRFSKFSRAATLMQQFIAQTNPGIIENLLKLTEEFMETGESYESVYLENKLTRIGKRPGNFVLPELVQLGINLIPELHLDSVGVFTDSPASLYHNSDIGARFPENPDDWDEEQYEKQATQVISELENLIGPYVQFLSLSGFFGRPEPNIDSVRFEMYVPLINPSLWDRTNPLLLELITQTSHIDIDHFPHNATSLREHAAVTSPINRFSWPAHTNQLYSLGSYLLSAVGYS